MPVHRDNLLDVVNAAWVAAQADARTDELSDTVGHGSRKDTNRNRSAAWVDALAKEFDRRYRGKRHRTFWRRKCKDKSETEFGLQEFLFDVMVCSVSETKSLQRQPRPLKFIAECHWQIESEFSRTNTRDIIVDMSKLVVGSAPRQLFTTSHRRSRNEELLEQCSELAGRCASELYFAFISHPDDWNRDPAPKKPTVYRWIAGDWQQQLSLTGAQQD